MNLTLFLRKLSRTNKPKNISLGYMGSRIQLTLSDRQKIADHVRKNISERRLDQITEIRKLKIMLNLFEQYGKEFEREYFVPDLNQRKLQVTLSNDPSRHCSIIIKATS